MLVFLVVHTGLMELVFLAENDHKHYLPELELFHKQHKELQGASLSTWETVKNTGFLRKTVAENYGRRSQIAKNLGKSAILVC